MYVSHQLKPRMRVTSVTWHIIAHADDRRVQPPCERWAHLIVSLWCHYGDPSMYRQRRDIATRRAFYVMLTLQMMGRRKYVMRLCIEVCIWFHYFDSHVVQTIMPNFAVTFQWLRLLINEKTWRVMSIFYKQSNYDVLAMFNYVYRRLDKWGGGWWGIPCQMNFGWISPMH